MKLVATLRVLVPLTLSLVASAAKQIPVIDGVIGGVPTSVSKGEQPAEAASGVQPQVSGTPVAGKLRFIENSGVCGKSMSGTMLVWFIS